MCRACILLVGFAYVAAGVSAQTGSLTRDRDPVVLTGADIAALTGLPVDDIVAFKYLGGWIQIPVQIDERKVVDYGVVYDDGVYGVTTLAYTDPNTYTGPDTDLAFDSDDELAFMAKDAGDRAGSGAAEPTGVVPDSGFELEITDPLDGGTGYVYLFASDGMLPPDAGQDYVTYVFDLLAGEYIPDYKTNKGPNPEDSEASSPYYRTHFSDRWVRDEVNVHAGASTGVDILDRHKNLFYVGYCLRSEDTFSKGEGAFFVNKDGPVRGIRSYMGANSGPLTQRVHHFYERRQDIATHLRVHEIPSMMDLYDYSSAATGMSYYNDLNLSGVLVDGVPDSITTGPIAWEMVTGVQGSLLISLGFETDITPDTYWSHYSDDITPSATQCTGDDYEYALSGVWVNHAIPNTDPRSPPYYYLTGRRSVLYEAPGQTVTDAVLHHDQTSTPLTVMVQAYQPTWALTLKVVNDAWGSIDLDPEPDDPNFPAYTRGTVLTLTAEPNEGKGFKRWLVFDPDYPGDANHATEDANLVLHLTLDANMEVEATFKCGGGSKLIMPLGIALLALFAGMVFRRKL